MINEFKCTLINIKLTLQEVKYWKLENKLLDHRYKMIKSYSKYKDVDEHYINFQMKKFKRLMLRWEKEIEFHIKLIEEGGNIN